MILYVNGDSHTAAAEAINSAAFANDDCRYQELGRSPHPDNLGVSWGTQLSRELGWDLVCDAESASSNDRIIRTTLEWVDHTISNEIFVILQWSTWEREEWLHDGVWYQVNASGQDQVPPELQDRYREFVVSTDWRDKTQQAHAKIWNLHRVLEDRGIAHVFFNGNLAFDRITSRSDWESSYLGPYDPNLTFDAVLRHNGFLPVNPSSYHYGPDSHCFWAGYLLQYMRSHNLWTDHAIFAD